MDEFAEAAKKPCSQTNPDLQLPIPNGLWPRCLARRKARVPSFTLHSQQAVIGVMYQGRWAWWKCLFICPLTGAEQKGQIFLELFLEDTVARTAVS